MAKEASPEVSSLPACSVGTSADVSQTTSGTMLPPSPSKASKSCHDSLELGIESEVETQVSDSSELPSSASAVAAPQLDLTGSSNATNVSILSEVQRLRQENQALRSENAELRRSPAPTPMATVPPTEYGSLTCGISSPATCQQNMRFGAPLRYMVVASPHGVNAGSFELGFDSADSQSVWRSIN